MAECNGVQFYDPNDETINFGRRDLATDGRELFESVTLATIESSKERRSIARCSSKHVVVVLNQTVTILGSKCSMKIRSFEAHTDIHSLESTEEHVLLGLHGLQLLCLNVKDGSSTQHMIPYEENSMNVSITRINANYDDAKNLEMYIVLSNGIIYKCTLSTIEGEQGVQPPCSWLLLQSVVLEIENINHSVKASNMISSAMNERNVMLIAIKKSLYTWNSDKGLEQLMLLKSTGPIEKIETLKRKKQGVMLSANGDLFYFHLYEGFSLDRLYNEAAKDFAIFTDSQEEIRLCIISLLCEDKHSIAVFDLKDMELKFKINLAHVAPTLVNSKIDDLLIYLEHYDTSVKIKRITLKDSKMRMRKLIQQRKFSAARELCEQLSLDVDSVNRSEATYLMSLFRGIHEDRINNSFNRLFEIFNQIEDIEFIVDGVKNIYICCSYKLKLVKYTISRLRSSSLQTPEINEYTSDLVKMKQSLELFFTTHENIDDIEDWLCFHAKPPLDLCKEFVEKGCLRRAMLIVDNINKFATDESSSIAENISFLEILHSSASLEETVIWMKKVMTPILNKEHLDENSSFFCANWIIKRSIIFCQKSNDGWYKEIGELIRTGICLFASCDHKFPPPAAISLKRALKVFKMIHTIQKEFSIIVSYEIMDAYEKNDSTDSITNLLAYLFNSVDATMVNKLYNFLKTLGSKMKELAHRYLIEHTNRLIIHICAGNFNLVDRFVSIINTLDDEEEKLLSIQKLVLLDHNMIEGAPVNLMMDGIKNKNHEIAKFIYRYERNHIICKKYGLLWKNIKDNDTFLFVALKRIHSKNNKLFNLSGVHNTLEDAIELLRDEPKRRLLPYMSFLMVAVETGTEQGYALGMFERRKMSNKAEQLVIKQQSALVTDLVKQAFLYAQFFRSESALFEAISLTRTKLIHFGTEELKNLFTKMYYNLKMSSQEKYNRFQKQYIDAVPHFYYLMNKPEKWYHSTSKNLVQNDCHKICKYGVRTPDDKCAVGKIEEGIKFLIDENYSRTNQIIEFINEDSQYFRTYGSFINRFLIRLLQIPSYTDESLKINIRNMIYQCILHSKETLWNWVQLWKMHQVLHSELQESCALPNSVRHIFLRCSEMLPVRGQRLLAHNELKVYAAGLPLDLSSLQHMNNITSFFETHHIWSYKDEAEFKQIRNNFILSMIIEYFTVNEVCIPKAQINLSFIILSTQTVLHLYFYLFRKHRNIVVTEHRLETILKSLQQKEFETNRYKELQNMSAVLRKQAVTMFWDWKIQKLGILQEKLTLETKDYERVLNELILIPNIDIDTLKRFCRDFKLNVDLCLLKYTLLRWQPKSELNCCRISSRDEEELFTACSAFLKPHVKPSEIISTLKHIQLRVNPYYYEVISVVLKLFDNVFLNPSSIWRPSPELFNYCKMQNNSLRFFSTMPRVSTINLAMINKWIAKYGTEITSVAQFRLPFVGKPLPIEDLGPEITLDNYDLWLSAPDFVVNHHSPYTNTDAICVAAIQNCDKDSLEKNGRLLQKAKQCIDRISSSEEAYKMMLYFAENILPLGDEKVEAMEYCIQYSSQWLLKNNDSFAASNADHKARRLRNKYCVELILSENGLDIPEYMGLVLDPEKLINALCRPSFDDQDATGAEIPPFRLYSHKRMNSVINAIAELFNLDLDTLFKKEFNHLLNCSQSDFEAAYDWDFYKLKVLGLSGCRIQYVKSKLNHLHHQRKRALMVLKSIDSDSYMDYVTSHTSSVDIVSLNIP